jgi:hypothetical protein
LGLVLGLETETHKEKEKEKEATHELTPAETAPALTEQDEASQLLRGMIPSVLVQPFWQCASSIDRYCESSCFQPDDQLEQLQAFVADTRETAEMMWQTSWMPVSRWR